jgi:hypothetical protein
MLPVGSNIAFAGGVCFSAAYETATLTSKSQDDFSISNLENYTVIVFTSTGDVDLKGLQSANVAGWQTFLIVNGNNFDSKLKIKKNQASSAAANRFFIKDEIEINFGEFYWVMYNPIQNRWNVHAKE